MTKVLWAVIEQLNSVHWLLLVVVGLLVFALLLAVLQYRAKLTIQDKFDVICSLIKAFQADADIEDNLQRVLDVVRGVVRAPYYAFYLVEGRDLRYTLRAVSHPYDLFEGVGPAYSGLALPKKEAYLPPSVIDDNLQGGADPVVFTKEGEVPLLIVRVGQKHGLLRIGPVSHIGRRQRELLRAIAQWLARPLEDFQIAENQRTRLEFKALSDNSITKIASMAMNPMGTIAILLQAFTGIVGGSGALFMERTERGVQVHVSEDLALIGPALQTELMSNRLWEGHFSGPDERIVTRQDAAFYELPLLITSRDDVGAVVIVPFDFTGTLVVLQNRDFDIIAWNKLGQKQLHFLMQQVQRMTAEMPVQRGFVKGYTRLLCHMADFVDNLNPYTVGYSDMMTHYSLAVGRIMGLSNQEMHDLALAARLCNIGVIGMDAKLLMKEGRYTDFEYSLIKRHAEISASMIELVTGNRQAANYVLYHHERVDGNGYPYGLTGSEIPRPAMIIHVIQVFLAKVNGRAWRTPLSFEMAMKELRNSNGTSLDKSVVEAFEQWWDAQAKRSARSSENLGYCYELCCVPRSICEACPAFKNPLRCWEMPENECRHHGRDCSTCFVKTEVQYRMAHSIG